MKKIGSQFLIAVIVAVVAWACGSKPGENVDEWKEMDEFHLVMADVYHPLKDSGDLAPIKERADELAAAADTWANSEIPAKADNDEFKGMLEKLKGGTTDLANQIVNGATDDEIGAQLTDLHELMHHLQEKWYDTDGAADHDH